MSEWYATLSHWLEANPEWLGLAIFLAACLECLAVAGILFCLGLVGLMVRRNILFVLMSLEVMMNAAALAFIVAGARWVQPDGQVMFILVISLAAAEASIGLAILLQLYRRFHTLDIDAASEMRG